MLELLILFLGLVLLYLFLYPKNSYEPEATTETTMDKQIIEPFKNPKYKLKIFVADFCGACKNYKQNKHDKLMKDLKKEIGEDNLSVEIIDDYKNNELMHQYQIEWFPTFIVESDNNVAKLPIEADANKDTLLNLLMSLKK